MTTQLDSLSMAVDDSDGRSTTSKFPRTRPSELNCKKGESGQEISLVANYIKILAAPKCQCLLLLAGLRTSIDSFQGISIVTIARSNRK